MSSADENDWLQVAARARGSFSTALVVTLGPGGRFLEAAAIGDTCLFVLDGFEPVCSFPLGASSAFDQEPALVGAEGDELPTFQRRLIAFGGLRQPSFALATDALARRLLECSEESRDRHPDAVRHMWRFLATASETAFEKWAGEAIDHGAIAADDLTLAWVR
jgi:hypothetical protein